jgi:DNA modification methylase
VIRSDLTPVILQGHVLDRLRELPEKSVHCVVTSPPYWGLRDYGVSPMVWGGNPVCAHVWDSAVVPTANGQTTHPMIAQTMNRASATRAPRVSESCGQCGAWRGQLGLEPTPQLFVTHLVEVFREVRRVLREDGTCWVNLGDTYVGAGKLRTGAGCSLKPKDLAGIPWRVAFGLQDDGWWLRSDCIWAKPNPMPEPLHYRGAPVPLESKEGSRRALRNRPARSHEYVFLLTRSPRYFYDPEAVLEPLQESTLRRLRSHIPNPVDNPNSRSKHPVGDFRRFPMLANSNPSGRHLRSVWWIAIQPYRGAHFATFPEKLAETCIKVGSPKDGVVLDPFAGSGTTLAVARALGRRSIGIELKPEYVELARQRCRDSCPEDEAPREEVPA